MCVCVCFVQEMVRRGEILDDGMEDEFYLRRLDAGLFVLQLICYIMVEINNSGISQVHTYTTKTHTRTHTVFPTLPRSFPPRWFASRPIRQDAEADGRQMVDTSAVAKWLMYLDSGGASRRSFSPLLPTWCRSTAAVGKEFGLDHLITTTAFKFCKQCLQAPSWLLTIWSLGSSVARWCSCSIFAHNNVSFFFVILIT